MNGKLSLTQTVGHPGIARSTSYHEMGLPEKPPTSKRSVGGGSMSLDIVISKYIY